MRFLVGKEKHHREPVTSAKSSVGIFRSLPALFFSTFANEFESTTEFGLASSNQFRAFEAVNLRQWDNLFCLTAKRDDAEPRAFQRLAIAAEIGDEHVDAVLHGRDGFARHGAGGVDEKVDGESAHACVLLLVD